MFNERSRYADVPKIVRVIDGREVTFAGRRLLPHPRAARGAQSVVLSRDARADQLADRMVGDSQLYWRIADANGAMNPFDLGRRGARIWTTKG